MTTRFYKQVTEWHRTPTINSREINGEVRQTAQQRDWMELVNGTQGRSGTGQLDIWRPRSDQSARRLLQAGL